MKRIVVLGGGISGLTAARCVQDRTGEEAVLLEQSPTVGGLTRTVKVGDFCFDYTGHFLHLSRYKSPGALPYASLHDADWMQVTRRSCCFIGGGLVTAPVQYHLGELPTAMLQSCMESYEAREHLEATPQTTFRDYVVRGFGQYLADIFLIPQNEKTMAIHMDRLSTAAVKRFFPPPNDKLMRAGAAGKNVTTSEYNAHFWYPRVGGIDRLVSGLAAGLDRVRTNQVVASLNLKERTLRTRAGDVIAWDILLSSMPLKTLCEITEDAQLRAWGSLLSHSSTISFNIGLRISGPAQFKGIHWIYVPDRSLPFYRVGFYSAISDGTCTPGCSSMYVEVGIPGGSVGNVDMSALYADVLAALEQLKWLDRKHIVCLVTHVIGHAYVHHTEARERVIGPIRARLRDVGVHVFGRYGLWDYTSMEDSMESARMAVAEALQ
jgi:protoporphyrinogen oxidase